MEFEFNFLLKNKLSYNLLTQFDVWPAHFITFYTFDYIPKEKVFSLNKDLNIWHFLAIN